jgi:nitrogen fixation protein FixH
METNNQDISTQQDQQPKKGSVYFWPAVVIGLLSAQVLLMAVVVIIATHDQAFAVEPDYYQKALSWNDLAAQQRENERLAWLVDLTLGDKVDPIGNRDLICHLTNSDGTALDGAKIEVLHFPHARGQQRSTVELEAHGKGDYATPVRFQRKGMWEFQIKITRGPDIFTKVVKRDVYPPGESRPWRP